MGAKQRVPHGLGPEGKKLFREITADFDFTGEAHKKRILIDACKTADAISRLEAESQTQPITTRGSMGQEVISPTLAACALARKDLAHFLSRLALPASEEEQAAKQDRISQARRRAAKIRAS
jgi:hypothetical protein